MGKYLLAYDADCGPCTSFKRTIDFLDVRRKIGFVALTQADESGFLDGIHPELRHKSFHLISRGGDFLSGANAIPRLLAELPFGGVISWFIKSAPGSIASMMFVYSVFSRLHGTGSCGHSA